MSTGKHIAFSGVELNKTILHKSVSRGITPWLRRYVAMLAVSFVSSLFHLNNSSFYEMSKVRKGICF